MARDMTAKGYTATKSFEGCSLKAYKDAVGVWTIGFGITNFDEFAVKYLGQPIGAGLTITSEQADYLLVESMRRKYLPRVEKALGPEATDGAFDAGGSFDFNTGAVLRASWPPKYRAKQDYRDSLLSWNKAGGKVLRGLDRRRHREYSMAHDNDYGPEGSARPMIITTNASGTETGAVAAPAAKPAAPPVVQAGLQNWHVKMESILGLYEFAGAQDNPAILEMARQCGGEIAKNYKHDTTAWCALTMNWCLLTSGHPGSNTLWALDFRKATTKLAGPAVGAIATKTRDGGGHVFIVRGRTADGRIVGTGGNQSDMVCDEIFDPSVLEFGWPKDMALPKVGMSTLPVVEKRAHTHKTFLALPGGTAVVRQTIPGMLQKGDSGPEVMDLQEHLLNPLFGTPVSGTLDDADDKAVRSFQHAHPQLGLDGVVGPATRVALQRELDAKRKLKTSTTSTATPSLATVAADQASGGGLSEWVYVALAIIVVGTAVYYGWKYRDELLGMAKRIKGVTNA
jgi:uncharacterized protein (TIGR02594 family)